MDLHPRVFVCGIGADGKAGIFGTTKGLVDQFGPERVFDTPIAEQALTAMAAGAANGGLRPILVHQRLDHVIVHLTGFGNQPRMICRAPPASYSSLQMN